MGDIIPKTFLRIPHRLKHHSKLSQPKSPQESPQTPYKSIEQILTSPLHMKTTESVDSPLSVQPRKRINRKKTLNVIEVQQFLDDQLNRSPLKETLPPAKPVDRIKKVRSIYKPLNRLAELNKHYRNSKKDLKPNIQPKIPKEVLLKEISRLSKMNVQYPISKDSDTDSLSNLLSPLVAEESKTIDKTRNTEHAVQNLYIPESSIPMQSLSTEGYKNMILDLALGSNSPSSIISNKDSPKSVKFFGNLVHSHLNTGDKFSNTARNAIQSFNYTKSGMTLITEASRSPKNVSTRSPQRKRSTPKSVKTTRRRSTLKIDTIGYRCFLARNDVKNLKRSCTLSNTEVSKGFNQCKHQLDDAMHDIKQILPHEFMSVKSNRIQISNSRPKSPASNSFISEKEATGIYVRDTFRKATRNNLTRDERYMYTIGSTWSQEAVI